MTLVKILLYLGMDESKIRTNLYGEIQKTVYLVQEIGLNCGFSFNLAMTDCVHSDWLTELLSEIGYLSFNSNLELNNENKHILDKLKEYLNNFKPESLDYNNWLRLLSTTHYLKYKSLIYKSLRYKNQEKDEIILNDLHNIFKNTKEEIRIAIIVAEKIEETRKVHNLIYSI